MNIGSFVPRPRAFVYAGLCVCAIGTASMPLPAAAQDSAFLACERFSDRGQRIACLEDALEAATAAAEGQAEEGPAAQGGAEPAVTQAPAPAPAATPTPAPAEQVLVPQTHTAPPAVVESADPGATTAPEVEDPSLLERLRNFGRDDDGATLSTDASGQDRLHDTIASLEKRRDAWIVTLASGQVWMQDYPRALALREGDDVTIYRGGFGNGYRLSTVRLSGFIRVKRVR
ncbi:MAG: hypothetical protein ACO1PZ_13825 [Gammaproteobacteria bacterium]